MSPQIIPTEELFPEDSTGGGRRRRKRFLYPRSHSFYKYPERVKNYKGRNQLSLYGKGAEYGSWIDTDIDGAARDNGKDSGDLIETQAGIIEFIARYIGLGTWQINIDSFDAAIKTDLSSWKLAGVIDDEKQWIKDVDFIAGQSKCILFFDRNNQLKIKAYDSSANFTNSETGTPGNADIFKKSPTVSSNRFTQHPIIESAIIVELTPIEDVVNEIYINYYKNYGSNQYEKTTFITDIDSDNGDGSRDQNAASPNNRESLSGTSKLDFGHTGRITLDAPFIRDSATAVLLRNHLFDILYKSRNIIVFRTWFNAISVELGDIINIQHPLIESTMSGYATKKWYVRRKDIIIAAREIELEVIELI